MVACENPGGFVLERPESWHADETCSQLHPDPFEPPGPTDERVAAITAYIDPVPFAEVAAPDPKRDADRAATTVSGLQAVRLEYEAGADALWPAGTPITLYAVDLATGERAADGPGPETLFLDTVWMARFEYGSNQAVLDEVARSLEITRADVDADPSVVARYEGATGFRVEGEVEGTEACLRIPPGGEPACTALPESDRIRTVDLVDLEPVLACIAGDDVFRVTAHRRDGDPASVLPSPIEGSDVRGFAFPFGPGEVERLRLSDAAGTELGGVDVG